MTMINGVSAVKYFSSFESGCEVGSGFDIVAMQEKIANVCAELERHDVKPVIWRKCTFYVSGDAVFAVHPLKRYSELNCFTLMDVDTYDKYLRGKAGFYFDDRDKEEYRVMIKVNGKYRELHRVVMGVHCSEDKIDHIYHSPFINTSDALRVYHDDENRHNMKFYYSSAEEDLPECAMKQVAKGESEENIYKTLVSHEVKEFGAFAYNPLQDFTYTWTALVLHKMLGKGTWSDLEDYNRDYIKKYDANAARYYKSIL